MGVDDRSCWLVAVVAINAVILVSLSVNGVVEGTVVIVLVELACSCV